MKFLNKLFKPKEVCEAIGILDEASRTFDCMAFKIIQKQIKGMILGRPYKFAKLIKKGTNLHQWIYTVIANISGDHIESGEYHIHTGILNPMGPGKDMLKIFDAATDELVRLEAFDADYAAEQKKGLRKNLRSVG